MRRARPTDFDEQVRKLAFLDIHKNRAFTNTTSGARNDMKSGFLDKLIERLGRIGPEEVQNYFLRLAQEKGFLETVFNAIQEGIIVTDSKGRITYLNDAAGELFGLEAGDAIGKRLDERMRGLDWESLTQSGGPVSRDMEIFYPANRFINFYIVPLMIGRRTPKDGAESHAEPVGHAMIFARHHREPALGAADTRVRTIKRAHVAGRRRGARDRQSAQFAAHPFAIDGRKVRKLDGKVRRSSRKLSPFPARRSRGSNSVLHNSCRRSAIEAGAPSENVNMIVEEAVRFVRQKSRIATLWSGRNAFRSAAAPA